MLIQLKRVAYTSQGTFGVLLHNGIPFAVTAEEIWRQNKTYESCIPTGRYLCKRYHYKDGDYETFKVLDVPNRSGILFHVGNSIVDTEGCILVGERYEHLNSRVAIWKSQEGFNEFMGRLSGETEFMLEVIDT